MTVLTVNHTSGEVTWNGTVTRFKPRQFKYFARLLRSRGVVVNLELIRDLSETRSHNIHAVYMCHIRKLIRDMPLKLETLWGWGYRLTVEPGVEIQEIKANG